MKELSVKNQLFHSSRIREMTILSNQCGAINLAQGFPEFAPPKALTDRLQAISNQTVHQYAPNWGIGKLREGIAKKQSKAFDREIDAQTEVLVTCGSTEAMMSVQMALFDPGDEVLIFSPYYSGYETNARIVGAQPVFVELEEENFALNVNRLENTLKEHRQKLKAMILCNPCNPCGKVYTREELLEIARLAIEYDLYVVTDEVYEHIVFKPHRYISLASLPGMFERTITCSSLSKTYSVTGWRLGYVTAPAFLIREIRKYHDSFTVCAPAPLQEAAVTALDFTEDYYSQLQQIYTGKKEKFCQGLDEIGLKHTNPQGSYFVLIDFSEFGCKDDVAFARDLASRYGVAGVPASGFFSDRRQNYIRFHFAIEDETLDEVLKRLAKLKRDFT